MTCPANHDFGKATAFQIYLPRLEPSSTKAPTPVSRPPLPREVETILVVDAA